MPSDNLLILDNYKISPCMIACGSRPKCILAGEKGTVYFKTGLEEIEICAEILAYMTAVELKIPVAETYFAKYNSKYGIASVEIEKYTEPDDSQSYGIEDFVQIDGFVRMCLFDYLIMNEDRHAGNWGIVNRKVGNLFDHNYCFGGIDADLRDLELFMERLTSPFSVYDDNHHRHDDILKYLCANYTETVMAFGREICLFKEFRHQSLERVYPHAFLCVNDLLRRRTAYFHKKVTEYAQ